MSDRLPPVRVRLRRAPIPYLVLLAGVVTTLGVAIYASQSTHQNDHVRFDSAVEQVRNSVTSRVDTYLALLRAGAGLFAASRDVTLPEFRNFVDRLALRDRYPGMQGIGFAKRVSRAELPGLTEQLNAEGPSRFAVRPDFPREEYYPIVYLEPFDRRNMAAIGYDMFTEPVRRSAMERAVRLATASASGKVTLMQEIDSEKQAGFLIYVPVYRRDDPTTTEAERLAALLGFVYSPFRAGDFLRAVLGLAEDREIDVEVYDGAQPSGSALLFNSAGRSVQANSSTNRPPRFQRRVTVDIAGRSWLIDVRTRPGFEEASEGRVLPWILFTGMGVSAVLFWLTRREVQARTVAERTTLELQRSEEALRAGDAELRRLVEAERQAHAEAEAASRAKDDFLATLSHELRTPLNAILGWATMMKDGRLPPDQQVKAVEVIARNARSQADLIEDLLDVSRIITGKLRIDLRPGTLSAPILAALDGVRPTADAKGIDLVTVFSTEGPVLGDPDRLQQVAWNLLSNAIKFTPAGGRIVVSLDQEGGELVLRVSDTGIGIDPAFLPHVFERFRQRDSSTTRAHGGMGLGLAIVRHLVELHAGTISATSEGEGKGATFVVTLPLRAVRPREVDHPAIHPRRRKSDQDLSGIRAVVVDDEHDSRELLGSVLTQSGAEVVTTRSADEAMEQLLREKADILLADISMPGMDGYTLMREVRSHPSEAVKKIPAIAVTAHAREEDRQKAHDAGFDDHIAKPVDVHVLTDAIRRLTETVRSS